MEFLEIQLDNLLTSYLTEEDNFVFQFRWCFVYPIVFGPLKILKTFSKKIKMIYFWYRKNEWEKV